MIWWRKRHSEAERLRLEEYPFYPFVVTEAGPIEFDPVAFKTAVEYLIIHDNPRAAGELIVIGEQNLVRDTFGSRELASYKELFERYDGESLIRDNTAVFNNLRNKADLSMHDLGERRLKNVSDPVRLFSVDV